MCRERVPGGFAEESPGMNGECATGSEHTGNSYIRLWCRTGDDPMLPFRKILGTVKAY
jgi:hypothetical protein